ncbi:MAG: hypothetical protein GXP54_07720 [Deltaproteobacteria bacterium]|nr:hypothetical protein [Deltaproteobacteria bacterium]
MTPCTVKLKRGRHHFEYKKDGFTTVAEDRIVGGGGLLSFSAKLQQQSGTVVFVTDLDSFDGVLIRMDAIEMTPRGAAGVPNRSAPMKVRAGSHQFLCVKEGLPPFMSTFVVAPDVTVEVSCRLRPPSTSNNRTWAWVTLSTGLAATAAGAGLVAWYYTAGSSKPSNPNANVVYQLNRRDYHENYYGFALLGLGVATAGLSAYFFMADQDEDRGAAQAPQKTRFSFGIAPAPGGAVASGNVRF